MSAKDQTVLWTIHGFLVGLNTSEIDNENIQPSERKVTMTADQYKKLYKYIHDNLEFGGKK